MCKHACSLPQYISKLVDVDACIRGPMLYGAVMQRTVDKSGCSHAEKYHLQLKIRLLTERAHLGVEVTDKYTSRV